MPSCQHNPAVPVYVGSWVWVGSWSSEPMWESDQPNWNISGAISKSSSWEKYTSGPWGGTFWICWSFGFEAGQKPGERHDTPWTVLTPAVVNSLTSRVTAFSRNTTPRRCKRQGISVSQCLGSSFVQRKWLFNPFFFWIVFATIWFKKLNHINTFSFFFSNKACKQEAGTQCQYSIVIGKVSTSVDQNPILGQALDVCAQQTLLGWPDASGSRRSGPVAWGCSIC